MIQNQNGSIQRNACISLQNIALCDQEKREYQERVTTGQTDGQTDAGQSDPYVLPCFAGDTKRVYIYYNIRFCNKQIVVHSTVQAIKSDLVHEQGQRYRKKSHHGTNRKVLSERSECSIIIASKEMDQVKAFVTDRWIHGF